MFVSVSDEDKVDVGGGGDAGVWCQRKRNCERGVTILLHGDLEDLWYVYMGADNVP